MTTFRLLHVKCHTCPWGDSVSKLPETFPRLESSLQQPTDAYVLLAPPAVLQ